MAGSGMMDNYPNCHLEFELCSVAAWNASEYGRGKNIEIDRFIYIYILMYVYIYDIYIYI